MYQSDNQRVSVRLQHDGGIPIALVMYVPESAVDAASPSAHSALINLGDRAGLPVFIVYHSADFSSWKARPLNRHARRWLSEHLQKCARAWAEVVCRLLAAYGV